MPPHEAKLKSRPMIMTDNTRPVSVQRRADAGKNSSPTSPTAQIEPSAERSVPRLDAMRPVVVTVTLNAVVELVLRVMLSGGVQVAAVGAPVQVNVAVPLKPSPPIDKLYVAVAPALIVCVDELPDGTVRPREASCAVPDKLTV